MQMPPAPPVSQIMKLCQPLLDEYTDKILVYLRADSDHPRQWLPGEGDGCPQWTVEEDAELRSLKIPTLPTPIHPLYHPDLVLYLTGELERLDDRFSERLTSVMTSDSHRQVLFSRLECSEPLLIIYATPCFSLIVNTSGTGKTRLLLEVLSRSWGFFFTCSTHPISSPYGSMDIAAVLDWLPTSSLEGRFLNRKLTLHGPGSRAAGADLARNRRIAHSLIYCVILGRLLVFNHFCSIADTLGLSDDVLRRRWLMLQLRPHQLLGDETFGMISRHLKAFPLDELLSELSTAFSKYGERLQFVALDEAQVASMSFTGAFALSDDKSPAPVLREIVRCMATTFQKQRLLVAGTQAELRVVADAVFEIPSSFSGFRHVYSLGSFGTVKRTTAYLRHFLGDTFTDEDCAEVHNLFQGRHRFLALFLSNVLIHGYRDLDTVMNSLHKLLTGYSRPSSAHVRLPYALIIEDNQLEHCSVSRQARQATFRYALTGEPTVLVSDQAADLVTLGLGLFCGPKASAILCEPLVFYRLTGWLLHSSRFDIGGRIRRRLSDWTLNVRGIDFAAGLASYLWTMFSGPGRRLSDALAFAGPVPFWSSHRAILVFPSLLASASAAADPDMPEEHSVTVARDPEAVFQWLRAGRCPFLVPDSAFGADLLFCLHVEDVGAILVTVFTEPYDAERPRRTSTVSPKDATSFYAHSRENQETLLSILREGPARPFDLGSKRRKPHPLRLNMLRVLCFARAAEPAKPYNPPVAVLDMDALLKLKHAPELSFSTLDDIIWGAFS